MTRDRKYRIFLDIIKSVKTCHDNQIADQDIKMENLVINPKKQVYLIDFGYSIYIENINNYIPKKFCGTPLYMAPEIISKKNHNRK